jgi:hypothetical protein
MIPSKIVALVAIVLGAAISIGNWLTIYSSWKEKRFVSAVPLLGAGLLVFGLCGFPATRRFAWLGIIADYGTLVVILSVPRLVNEFWSTSRVNLLRSFISRQSGRVIEIRLFKKGVFTVRVKFDPPVPCNPPGAFVESFGLVGSWKQEGADFVLSGYAEDRVLRLRPEGERFLSEEANYPADNEYPYDSLAMITFEPGKGRP